MSSDEVKREKSPILPNYYKAEISESTGSTRGYKPQLIQKRKNLGCCVILLIVVLVAAAIAVGVGVGVGVHYSTKSSTFYLQDNIKISDLMQLLTELQNTSVDGSRSVLTGYNNSAEFVIRKLNETGYDFDIQIQNFSVPVPVNPDPDNSSFIATASIGDDSFTFEFSRLTQFDVMIYSASCDSDDCTSSLESLLNDDNDDEYGCDITQNFTGDAVLMYFSQDKGNCTVFEKAQNAKIAGATAVIFVSDVEYRNPLITRVFDRLDNGSVEYVDIVSIAVTNDTGEQLLNLLSIDSEMTVTIETLATVTTAYTYNVIATTKEGKEDSAIVFGSHLDSVPAGPGINDDGSGSMANLQIAIEVAKSGLNLKNQVRFAWWGAEELGLLGSRYYVGTLEEEGKDNISLYLNFDMLGSPNFQRGVHDAQSANNDLLLNASTTIQNLFVEYFNRSKITYELVPFTGGSDYRPFLDANIPAGGVQTGAGGIKSEEQWKLFGGLRNTPFDPCYHQSCDTVNNINQDVYEQMTKAAAYTLQTLMEQDDLERYLENSSTEE